MKTSDIDRTWQRILDQEGGAFQTIRGLGFVSGIEGDGFNTFRAAFELMPLDSPGQIGRKIRGSSNVWAILNDPRIKGDSN